MIEKFIGLSFLKKVGAILCKNLRNGKTGGIVWL